MTHLQLSPLSFPARRPFDLIAIVASVAVAACLAIDAYVHLADASQYDSVSTSLLSQGALFRAEGVIAALAAIVLLVRRRAYAFAVAGVVLAAGFGAVVLYTYVNVGQIGPVPNMYEPTWALPGKMTSAWAEGSGAVLCLLWLLVSYRRRRA